MPCLVSPKTNSPSPAQRSVHAGAQRANSYQFDTADVYSLGVSEELTGRALRDFAKRNQVVIATKVHGKMGAGPNDGALSRKHILDSIDASLRRLGTDYVDLYQIHGWDSETPIEETLGALNDVVRSGKARYIGASSMYAWQLPKRCSLPICAAMRALFRCRIITTWSLVKKSVR